jgi:hypothetical protein
MKTTLENMRPFIPLMEAMLGYSLEEYQGSSPVVGDWIGRAVVVRDHDAGVHVGILEYANIPAKFARLKNARKIWEWAGAFSVHGVAEDGVGEGSKLGPVVEGVISTHVVEIVLCAESAMKQIMEFPTPQVR